MKFLRCVYDFPTMSNDFVIDGFLFLFTSHGHVAINWGSSRGQVASIDDARFLDLRRSPTHETGRSAELANVLFLSDSSQSGNFSVATPSPVQRSLGSGPNSAGVEHAAWADYDGDGAPDVVIAQSGGDGLRLYKNTGAGRGAA